MGPRFKFYFAAAVFFVCLSSREFASAATQTDQDSEALEMIGRRMRSLTNSLEKMPQPPAFNQTLQLPEMPVNVPKKNNDTQNFDKEKR